MEPGTFKLRIQLGQTAPQYRELTVVVTSRQTVPVYVDGVTAVTNGGTIYRGTPMTTYGHLRVRQSNGRVVPFAGQRLTVGLMDQAMLTYYTVATTAPTTSTGYFIVHWTLATAADPLVRIFYTSPYETIRSGDIYTGTLLVTP